MSIITGTHRSKALLLVLVALQAWPAWASGGKVVAVKTGSVPAGPNSAAPLPAGFLGQGLHLIPPGSEAQWRQTALEHLWPRIQRHSAVGLPPAAALLPAEELLPPLVRLGESLSRETLRLTRGSKPAPDDSLGVKALSGLRGHQTAILDLLSVLAAYPEADPALMQSLQKDEAEVSQAIVEQGRKLVASVPELASKLGLRAFGRTLVIPLDEEDGLVLKEEPPDMSKIRGPLVALKHARPKELAGSSGKPFQEEAAKLAAVDRLGLPVPIPLPRDQGHVSFAPLGLPGAAAAIPESKNPFLAYLLPEGLARKWWVYYGAALPASMSLKRKATLIREEALEAVRAMAAMARHGWRQSTHAAITHGAPWDWFFHAVSEGGLYGPTGIHNLYSGTDYPNIRAGGIPADYDGIRALAPPGTEERALQGSGRA